MVAESHGMWSCGGEDKSRNQWVQVCQVGEDGIELSHTKIHNPVMTVDQARYLASKLNRLASKIESQNA